MEHLNKLFWTYDPLENNTDVFQKKTLIGKSRFHIQKYTHILKFQTVVLFFSLFSFNLHEGYYNTNK